MRVHRSMPKRDFTAFRNALLQDSRLSLGAHGLLTYLLSQEDRKPTDIKILSSIFSDSQARIAGYLHELVRWGYMIRRRIRDVETRVVRTVVEVFDIPQTVDGNDLAVVSLQVVPESQPPESRESECAPYGRKDGDKKPSPPQVPLPFAELGGEEDPSPIHTEDQAAGAALLARIGRQEPKLALGAMEMLPLLPLVAEWRLRSASDAQIRQAMTEGLPRHVFSPKALLQDRLVRKMPPLPITVVTKSKIECQNCGRPMSDVCRHCSGQSSDQKPEYKDSSARGVALARQFLGLPKAS